uniref:Uncharacterized protein n=1 Tax=Lepeophtheirus salmonis TaxID=72036 RepID=A0A0K2TZF3_LEPSM
MFHENIDDILPSNFVNLLTLRHPDLV